MRNKVYIKRGYYFTSAECIEKIVVYPDGSSVNLTHAAKEKDFEIVRPTDANVGSGKVRNCPGSIFTNAFY